MVFCICESRRHVHALADEPNRIVHTIPDGVGGKNCVEVFSPAQCVAGGFIDLAASRDGEVIRTQDAADFVADLRLNADCANDGIFQLRSVRSAHPHPRQQRSVLLAELFTGQDVLLPEQVILRE